MALRMPGHACGLLLGWLLSMGAAHAGVVIDGTRVIYPAKKREVSINLHNVTDAPSLVQVWVDSGDMSLHPTTAKAPFALTPPLFRLDPAHGQTLRLIYTQDPLPTDRESVFWLNVLDIPPRAAVSADNQNKLEMAFRHRLKVFFRPPGLAGDPARAPGTLTWTVSRDAKGAWLEAKNPTPWYISLTSADVVVDHQTDSAVTRMLAPMASARMPLSGPVAAFAGPITVRYEFVNDFGAVVTGQAAGSVAQ